LAPTGGSFCVSSSALSSLITLVITALRQLRKKTHFFAVVFEETRARRP